MTPPSIAENYPRGLKLVGDFTGAEKVKEIWEKSAVRFHKDCNCVTLPGFRALDGAGVLALVNPALEPVSLVREVMSTAAHKVLYLPSTTNLAPSKVIEYCKTCGVRDAFSVPDDPTMFGRLLTRFEDHLWKLLDNKTLYGPILHDVELCPGDRCFIATPFVEPYKRTFDEGVEAAMRGLGMKVNNPGDEYRLGKKITNKILDMIDESDIVAANIRQIKGRYNPNVFYELGYSRARSKILLPFRHASDTEFAPVDIRDEDYFPYEDSIDLALQLYFGLLAKVTHAATA